MSNHTLTEMAKDPERAGWVVSVDDHVIEPSDLWLKRLPSKYHDVCPRVEKNEQGIDVWRYEGKQKTVTGLVVQAGAGPEGYDPSPVNYSDMRPACYDAKERLRVMDEDHVLASMVFPNFPRFCGQEFWEADDKELALLGVKAYNDFIIDEWSAVDPRRLISAIIIPLWDPAAAAQEIERCAAKGARSVIFCEFPPALGLPSIHSADLYWEPVFAAAEETAMVISMHIGSSSTVPNTGPDAPYLIRTVLARSMAATTCADWMFCDAIKRHPRLRIALSEGGIGWVPPLMEAASYAVDHYQYNDRFRRDADDFLQVIRRDEPVASWPHGDLKPLDVYRRNIRACFVGGLAAYADYTRHVVSQYGADLFLSEADFPHHDSSYPHTAKILGEVVAPFPQQDQDKLLRLNAIEWYGLS